MKILAVDTASSNCSIAIVEASNNKFNILAEENNSDAKTHSQKLMPMVKNIFDKLATTLDDINLIACCTGPGSFTGIRIGIATCKAFVDSKNILATGVSSLESLAHNVETPGYIISLLDCKNENVYGSLYFHDESGYTKISDFMADNISNVLNTFLSKISKNQTITFVGYAALIYKDLIEKTFTKNSIVFSSNNTQSAVSLAKCAYNNFLNKKTGDSSVLSPLYLRASQAERMLKEKKNS